MFQNKFIEFVELKIFNQPNKLYKLGELYELRKPLPACNINFIRRSAVEYRRAFYQADDARRFCLEKTAILFKN